MSSYRGRGDRGRPAWFSATMSAVAAQLREFEPQGVDRSRATLSRLASVEREVLVDPGARQPQHVGCVVDRSHHVGTELGQHATGLGDDTPSNSTARTPARSSPSVPRRGVEAAAERTSARRSPPRSCGVGSAAHRRRCRGQLPRRQRTAPPGLRTPSRRRTRALRLLVRYEPDGVQHPIVVPSARADAASSSRVHGEVRQRGGRHRRWRGEAGIGPLGFGEQIRRAAQLGKPCHWRRPMTVRTQSSPATPNKRRRRCRCPWR